MDGVAKGCGSLSGGCAKAMALAKKVALQGNAASYHFMKSSPQIVADLAARFGPERRAQVVSAVLQVVEEIAGKNTAAAVEYAGQSSPADTIRSQIITGRNTGSWDGNGITSSTAALNPNKFAVGYAEADITPAPGEAMLAGFGQPRQVTGTLAPLRAQALAFEDGNGRRALLITADVLSCVITCSGRMETKSPVRNGRFGPSVRWACAIFSTIDGPAYHCCGR